MSVLSRRCDRSNACPACAVTGRIEFRTVALPLALAICAAWMGASLWDLRDGHSTWRMLGLVAALPVIALPWFGRCAACGTRLHRTLKGGWAR